MRLLFLCVVSGMGNTSLKDMDSLLPLMNMVIYSIDKVKKLRLNREVSRTRRRLICSSCLLHDSEVPQHVYVLLPAFRANRRPTRTELAWRRTS